MPDLYGHAKTQEPLPGGYEIYNFSRHFPDHYKYTLCSYIE